jgi:hypothetical protein
VELYRPKKQAKLCHDHGPTLAAEELAEDYGIAISRETLRQRSHVGSYAAPGNHLRSVALPLFCPLAGSKAHYSFALSG